MGVGKWATASSLLNCRHNMHTRFRLCRYTHLRMDVADKEKENIYYKLQDPMDVIPNNDIRLLIKDFNAQKRKAVTVVIKC